MENQYNQRDFLALPQEEQKFFKISYSYYQDSECNLKKISKTACLRKILEVYRKVCKCSDLDELKGQGIRIDRIPNNRAYATYYNSLPEDIELRHFDSGKGERVIYFVTGNIFNVRVILNQHTEDKKNFK